MTPVPGEQWHALLTEPCREKLAQRHLTLRGLDAFYPTMVRRHVLKGHRMETLHPLFPGYTFCLMSARHHGVVESVAGVCRVVGALRPGVGELLLALEPRQPVEEQVARILVGMNVRVRVGPLTGHVAKVSRSHHERVKLLVCIFNSDHETNWLPASWVEAISAEAEAA